MNKLLIVLCIFITGCASFVSRSVYPVNISGQPARADITIRDEQGTMVYKGQTPTVVNLKTSRGYFQGIDYRIVFNKDGYDDYHVDLVRGVDGWYIIGNAFFGSLAGWLIVDPLTGAMWTLPTEINPNFEHRRQQK